MHELSTKILLYTHSKETKKGFPIKMRLTKNRQTKFVHLNVYSSKAFWNPKVNLVKSQHPDFVAVNKRIKEAEIKAMECLERNFGLDDSIKYISGKSVSSLSSFSEFARNYIEGLEKAGRTKTAITYNTGLDQFERISGNTKLQFSDLTYTRLLDFRNEKMGEGVSNSTIHNYLRVLRTLVNAAINAGYMDQSDYPFKKGLFPKVAPTRKQAITKEDVQRLKSLELKEGSLMEIARDIFLLQYYLAGIDYVDLIQLPANIVKKPSIRFLRQKLSGGGFEVEVPIIEPARALIKKYAARADKQLLFAWHHQPSENKLYASQRNRIQKKMAILLPGIKIGTKTARHTFASHGRQAGVDPDLLAQLMGHEVPGYQIANVYKERYGISSLKLAISQVVE
ncbi:site-specific integrase [Phaeocystidibacter marisrubri]|uniref:Tyrosine-type recombinase/integrase n=1 Tax=Phaeocystidibacter marisrubri TaxID=1577780 RepID=A0A6L3ZD94_9FLAO|nr:site-specific integrase [Phaeocystidibacter marisrubri]KAB2815518.1 tyrosine-type recombinase/integrase [Phaeocystidibacter marisrubri]GGH64306.1 hypothetical protein GCM10011318_00200 [Phaeocystidibacter marisrubri]